MTIFQLSDCQTLLDLVRFRASEHSGTAAQKVFSFHEDGQGDAQTITFAQLHEEAKNIAAHLQRSTQPGDRVLLAYPPGLAYITAFVACAHAGVVAVPALPPTTRRTLPRLRLIAKDAQPKVGLTLRSIATRISEFDDEDDDSLSCLTWLQTDGLLTDDVPWVAPKVAPGDIAFLQYTSGSTAAPRAVMVSHANIIVNLRLIQATLEMKTSDVMVSWLPPHHDMGLIGTILYALHAGFHSVLFPPAAFLSRPHRWLQLMSQYRARLTTAPNFAYDLCVSKVSEEQKASLDLSGLVFALNGAEPVRPETMQRFVQSFGPCGFRAQALTPAYGLAEATLLVSANALKQAGQPGNVLTVSREALSSGAVVCEPEASDSVALVSHGRAQPPGHEIAIADPVELVAVAEDVVGEIWVHGPSIARGYWNKPQETEHTFGARLKGSQRRYLRTGDLGFIHAGELYITGRAKDVMIFNGRNIYPQDIEIAVEQLDPSFRANGCAAFAVERQGQPRLVIVQELESRRDQPTAGLADKVRAELIEQHELFDLEAIVLVRPGHVPRTSSGKIQRSRCRALYLAGEFAEVWSWTATSTARVPGEQAAALPSPQTPTESRLAAVWGEILGVDAVSREADFFVSGGHSLAATRLMQAIADQFGVRLPMVELFEHPKLHQLAGLIDGVTRERAVAGTRRIEPDSANRFVKFPLTEVQQAYWLGRQNLYALGGVAAHAYQEVRLCNIEPATFDRALNQLIQRHDMLRAIVCSDGTQQVLGEVPLYETRCNDLRGWSKDQADAELRKVRDEMSHQVLDTQTWPLFDFRLTRVDEESIVLHMSIDLLICDAWSGRILVSELSRLCQDPSAPLPPLALSFRDCVLAQRAARDDQTFSDAKAYWDQRLTSLPLAPELPLATNPDTVQAPRFERRDHVLSKPQWTRLKALAAASGVTPSAVLLAAFSEVIGFWSRHPDFTINLTLFNRPAAHPQIDAVVGDFTSLTLLEVHTGQASAFEQKAKSVQAQLWRDLDHTAVSAIQVLRDMARARGLQGLSMPVVFTSTLVDAPDSAEASPGLLDEVCYSISQTPQVWLDHQVFERQGELLLVWDAVEALFPEQLLDQMFGAYCDLLSRLCDNTGAWQEPALDLMPAACRQAQQAANATDVTHREELIHEAFHTQACLAPGRVAVISGDVQLSYGELRDRSQGIAAQLQHLGAAPNQPVAIVMAKGWEQVVAALAVSYSGACYLPLDPALPAQRMLHILEVAQVSTVLTQSRFADLLAWPAHIHRIVVDGSGDTAPAQASALKPLRTSPSDLAYVIYTSGSTGLPKGVMIQHAAAVNTLQDLHERFCVSPDDRVLALSALSFDLSVFDIFGTLAAGAAIVMPNEDAALDPAHWHRLLHANRVSVWNSVPVFLEMMVDHVRQAGAALPASLRLVMLSGDWIPLALPERLRALCPSARVVSLGGATEASIWSIFHEIDQVLPAWKSIPYGKALRNQRMYVLDEKLQPRPSWATGEIFIGGKGLAAGYWRDEEKSRERFIVHPRTGERLYRTGDLGRYFTDGSIEFLGREDSQVKIQGHRIELGEIEAALLSHAQVERAAVIVVGEGGHGKRLAAYVVAKNKAGLADDELRKSLSARLPYYMVPSTFAFIDAIPLSANGKINKQALPAVAVVQPACAAQALPGSADEDQIAGIVEQTLGIEGIDRSENLLYLGASSIDLVRISNTLFAQLGFRPKLNVFLANPSIDSLIEAYRQREAADGNASQHGSVIIEGAQERKAFIKRQHGRRTFESISRHVSLVPESRAGYSRLYGLYKSNRRFLQTPILQKDFAGFLGCLAEGELDGEPKYLYASAGGAYPIQAYVYVKPSRVQGVAGGAYYHDAKRHCLVATGQGSALPAQVYDSFVNRPVYEEAAFAIFFIARMSAIEPLYGPKSVDFCHIEAGAMAQLLTAWAPEHRIGLCGIGVIDTDHLTPLFGLDPDHRLVYSMLGGSVAGPSAAPAQDMAASFGGAFTGSV